jgi:hypothetical protein
MDTQLSNLPPVADRLALDYEDLRAEITAAISAVPDLTYNGEGIANDEAVLAAREAVMPLKALQGKVSAAFKAEKAPYLEGGRTVDEFFKSLRVWLDMMVSNITREAGEYQARKLAAARAQAAEDARTAAFLDEPVPEPPKPAAAARVSDNGAVAVSGAIKWDFEVVDLDAVPRELLQINTAAVKAKVAGLKAVSSIDKAAGAIPGLRIVERISTTFR